MRPDLGFPLAFGATLLLLTAVVYTGIRRRLGLHLPLVGLALASLGTAIYFAVKLGELYDLEAAGPITGAHLFIAKLTTVLYLLPLGTGVMTLRNRNRRRLHFIAAMTVLSLTLLTATSGILMLYLAPRL